ncbi:hypothetical protein HDZ31DRAFT_62936 [Schizophyllum fasciatum]
MVSPILFTATLLLSGLRCVQAWFRVACTSPLVSERVDPIINPGVIPANHVHTIHGGSNFAANSTYDQLVRSDCTSCKVVQDKTNYWFPKLYFKDPAVGKYEEVANGGLLIYYQNRGDEDVQNGGRGLKAFPPGFKMISGRPTRRGTKYALSDSSQGALSERAQFYSCLRYGSAQGYDGIGKSVGTDSPKPTVSQASALVFIFLLAGTETSPGTFTHLRVAGINPTAGRLSIPLGLSWHGDFQNGWEIDALQNAIDKCDNRNDATGTGSTEACRYLTVQDSNVAGNCKIRPVVNEVIGGAGIRLDKLPGCNPLQYGPQDAVMFMDSNCPV